MFHITIGSSPKPDLSLEHDLRLIKAALLYADQVKLCSLTSSMLLSVMFLRDLKDPQKIEFLESVIPAVHPDPQQAAAALANLQLMKQVRRGKNPSKQELLLRARVKPQLARSWDNLKETIDRMLKDAGMDNLLRVTETNMLQLHMFGAAGQKSTGEWTKEFVDLLTEMISNGSTYPLFDDQTGNLVRLRVREGKIAVSDAGVARGRHSGLAARLLERLPLFDLASIDELLDIRRELDRPLVRFRGTVIKFTEKIKTASWDEEFSYDAEQVFQRDIEPAILDIEDAVKSNGYLATLTRKLTDKPLTLPSGSGLAMLMSQMSALPDIVTQSLGVGGAAGLVAYDAYKEWQQKNEKVEQNCLFFYYKARERLSEDR